MGYKLSGYDVLGGVEIDPKMSEIYKKNHNPKHMFEMGVGDFNKLPKSEIPSELFNLDILDGSPPCSSFSRAGSREKQWGKKKKFREGQAEQVLDDLFFDFIATAKKLQPKVVVAENVKGLIQGHARGYVKQIFQGFREAGYLCQLFLLNASRMGVPQRRERTFFIANRLDKKIALDFNELPISVSSMNIAKEHALRSLSDRELELWHWLDENKERCGGKASTALYGKRARFNTIKLQSREPASTITANCNIMHWSLPRKLYKEEVFQIQSFPLDYNCDNYEYLCGMSVPPYMTNRLSTEIYKQLLCDEV